MKPTEPGVRLSIGRSGSGKTYAIMRDVYAGAKAGVPTIVVDQMYEWQYAHGSFATVAEAAARLAREPRATLAIVHPSDDAAAVEDAAAWAMADRGTLRAVAMPEIHNIAHTHAHLSPNFKRLLTAWRHFKVAAYFDTQRVAQMHRTVAAQSSLTRVFAVTDERDLATVRDIGGGGRSGDLLVAAVTDCARRMSRGEPGWHVALGLDRAPPYRVVRA